MLEIGQTISHYKIMEKIGQGGMGEVYRAKDLKLDRDVAIKVLPEEFAKDADRVARFQREAKLLASLNHPNIAAIYGLEESDGTNFLVLELIEGNTLADRIKSGPIPVEEALKLALQIAEALEAAHEKGVIHRDLKPANIKVTPDGKVKVLDFGLAKAFAGEQDDLDLSNSSTLSDAATQGGTILGTTAYMPPEQANGISVDKRADIWSFGVVLFEMLTGKQLFIGETASEILASVLKTEPEWNHLPPNLHFRIRLLLERCLEKDRRNRYRDIGDPRIDIQFVLNNPNVSTSKSQPKKLGLTWISATGVIALVVGLIVWNIRQPSPHTPLRIPLDVGIRGDSSSTFPAPLVAISPDGKKVVSNLLFSSSKLFDLSEMDSSPVQLTTSPVHRPVAFSPDGQWIMSVSENIQKVPVDGGKESILWKGRASTGATWEKDGSILVCQPGRILHISEGKEKAETLLELAEGEICGTPQLLPGGEWVLFSVADQTRPNPWTSAQVVIQSITSDERRIISRIGISPRYVPTGHIVYIRENKLFGVRFDLKTMRAQNEALVILNRVRTTDATADYDFSDTGSLVYISGGNVDTAPKPGFIQRFFLLDRKGKEVPTPLSNESRYYKDFRLAPNGRQVAATVRQSSGDTILSHIWIYDIASGYGKQLTYGREANNYGPVWTADGKSIVYLSSENGRFKILRKTIESPGKDELLYQSKTLISALDISKNGTLIFAYNGIPEITTGSMDEIWTLPPDYKNSPSKFMTSTKDFGYSLPRFSPDGKWVAYTSDESGKPEIYVQPYPKSDTGKKRISVGGGKNPAWSPDGRTLFYTAVNVMLGGSPRSYHFLSPRMMEAQIQTEPDFEYKPPVELFKMDLFNEFEVTPGNDQFVLIDMDQQNLMTLPARLSQDREQVYLILNWFEDLKDRIPVP